MAQVPHIIICTPGRMIHHLENDQADLIKYLQNLQMFVIDEADRLILEQSFSEEIKVNRIIVIIF